MKKILIYFGNIAAFLGIITVCISLGCNRVQQAPEPPHSDFYMLVEKAELNDFRQVSNKKFMYNVHGYAYNNSQVLQSFTYYTNNYLRVGDTVGLVPSYYRVDTVKTVTVIRGDSVVMDQFKVIERNRY